MRVILDTDPGNGFPGADIDDGLALGLILASPEFSLEAVTIVGGNTAVERGVASARHMLALAGSKVPVFAGSPRAIVEDSAIWRARLDGFGLEPGVALLWAEVAQPAPAIAEPEHAASAIARIVDEHPGEVTIIAVGPLTNVAEAMLLDPELPRKVKQLAIMGGGFALFKHLQEMNFGYDPEAAHIVLACGAPTLLVPLDATLKTSFRLADNDRLKDASSPLTRFLAATADPWIRYLGRAKGVDGCPLHDPLAVAALLQRDLVTIENAIVDVELQGTLTRGRSVAWAAHRTALTGTKRLPDHAPIEVATNVDNAEFVEFLVTRLRGLSP